MLRISPQLTAVILGQLISLLIAATGVSSTYLVLQNVDVPTFQSLLNYCLLSLYLLAQYARHGRSLRLGISWKRMALLAVADVEANFLIVLAYRYTSITSVMLLDCFTIPTVMLLSRRYLHSRFSRQHYAGVAVCLLGLLILVAADSSSGAGGDDAGNAGTGTSALYGDLLCLGATLLYAVSNVGQELLVKRHDRGQYLGMLGSCGAILAAVQVAIFEREALAAVEWNSSVIGYLLAFALSLFAMYSLTSLFLSRLDCDATAFNLSLLTSDAWAVLAAVLLFHNDLSPWYFLSLGVTVAGVIIYNRAPTPAGAHGEGAGAGAGADAAGGSNGANGDSDSNSRDCETTGVIAGHMGQASDSVARKIDKVPSLADSKLVVSSGGGGSSGGSGGSDRVALLSAVHLPIGPAAPAARWQEEQDSTAARIAARMASRPQTASSSSSSSSSSGSSK